MKTFTLSASICAISLFASVSAQAQSWTIAGISFVSSYVSPPSPGSQYSISQSRPDVRAHSEMLGSDGGSTYASVQAKYTIGFIESGAGSSPRIHVDMNVDANGNITYGPNNSPDPHPKDETQLPPPGTSNEAADSSSEFYMNYLSGTNDDSTKPYVRDATSKGTKDSYPNAGDQNPLGGTNILLDFNIYTLYPQSEIYIDANVVADSSVNVSKGNTGAATGQGYMAIAMH